jgi:hypothetical protein
LLLRRLPHQNALRVSIPASPSESGHSHALQAALSNLQCDSNCSNSPRDAKTAAAATLPSAQLAAEGCSIISPPIANGPVCCHASTLSSCKDESGKPPADAADESSLNFIELSVSIQNLEQEIQSFRREMLGNDDNTLDDGAAQEDTFAKASPANNSSVHRSSTNQPSQDNVWSAPDFISPRMLFQETNEAKFSKRCHPDEASLVDLLLHNLQLPPNVASLVVRHMHDVARRNEAARADFRANFFANVGVEGRGSASHVHRILETAERAVQLRAAREAEEEEERFHMKVLAGLAKRSPARK